VVGLAINTANSVFVGNDYAIERKLTALQETYHINDGSGNLLAYVKRSGLDFTFETSEGSRIGEIHGVEGARRADEATALFDFQVLDAEGKLVATIKEIATPHPRTGFLKTAAWNFDFSWSVEGPAGEDLARIERAPMTKSLQTPNGVTIAEFHRKVPALHQNCAVHITNPVIDQYLVLACLFAHPPTERLIRRPELETFGGVRRELRPREAEDYQP
jgi:hypothetical protein